jgi:DNA polymerase
MPHRDELRALHEITLLTKAWLRGETAILPTLEGGISPYSEKRLEEQASAQVHNQLAPLAPSADEKVRSLEALRLSFSECQRCSMAEQRRHLVFGEGEPTARLLLIGEAPNADDDRSGIAISGPAGELLTKMLAAINLQRDEVYISNIIKCRPPEDRDPLPEEFSHCREFLDAQIEIIRPLVIVCLGPLAINGLLSSPDEMASLRGKTLNYRGIPVIPTFSPSSLLRDPRHKRDAWEDLKRVRRMLDEGVHAIR